MDRREDAGEFYPGGKVAWTRSTPVSSVNGKTGVVVLGASDVGALPLSGETPMTGALETPGILVAGSGKRFRIGIFGGNLVIANITDGGVVIIPNVANSGTLALLSDIYAAVQQIAPAWVSGTAYTAKALVTYNGVAYRCKANTVSPHTATPDTDTTHWEAKKVSELFLPLEGGGTIHGNLSVVGYSSNPYTPYQYRIELDAGGQRINLYRGDVRVSSLIIPYTPYEPGILALDSDIDRVEGKLRYAITRPWDGLDALGSNVVAELVVTSPTAVLNAYAPALDSGGRVYDFYADVVNEYGANAEIELGGLGSDWEAVVRDGESLSQMTTLAPGEMARFHFTKTAFVRNGRPVFLVTKTVLVEPSSGGGTYQLETDGTVSTEGELNSDGTFTVEGELNSDGTFTVEAL